MSVAFIQLLRRIIPPRCTRQSGIKALPPGGASGASSSGYLINVFIVTLYNSLCVLSIVIVENHSPNEILRFRPAPEPTNSAGRPVSPNVRRAEQAELRLQPQEDGRDLQVHELLGQFIGYLL